MIAYIDQNTSPSSVFYGSYLIRTAADRAVVLDSKGAGMLIEGNPNKFVQWYLDIKKFEALQPAGKIKLLQFKKVNYILTDTAWVMLVPEKQIGKYYLYKI